MLSICVKKVIGDRCFGYDVIFRQSYRVGFASLPLNARRISGSLPQRLSARVADFGAGRLADEPVPFAPWRPHETFSGGGVDVGTGPPTVPTGRPPR
jgi:hypothetical protein